MLRVKEVVYFLFLPPVNMSRVHFFFFTGKSSLGHIKWRKSSNPAANRANYWSLFFWGGVFNAWHLGGIFYIFTQPTVDDRKVPRHAEGGYCADAGKVWDSVNQKGGHPVAPLCPLLGKRLEIWLSTIRLRRVLTWCLADGGAEGGCFLSRVRSRRI